MCGAPWGLRAPKEVEQGRTGSRWERLCAQHLLGPSDHVVCAASPPACALVQNSLVGTALRGQGQIHRAALGTWLRPSLGLLMPWNHTPQRAGSCQAKAGESRHQLRTSLSSALPLTSNPSLRRQMAERTPPLVAPWPIVMCQGLQGPGGLAWVFFVQGGQAPRESLLRFLVMSLMEV